jgi:hypothetical protein
MGLNFLPSVYLSSFWTFFKSRFHFGFGQHKTSVTFGWDYVGRKAVLDLESIDKKKLFLWPTIIRSSDIKELFSCSCLKNSQTIGSSWIGSFKNALSHLLWEF